MINENDFYIKCNLYIPKWYWGIFLVVVLEAFVYVTILSVVQVVELVSFNVNIYSTCLFVYVMVETLLYASIHFSMIKYLN